MYGHLCIINAPIKRKPYPGTVNQVYLLVHTSYTRTKTGLKNRVILLIYHTVVYDFHAIDNRICEEESISLACFPAWTYHNLIAHGMWRCIALKSRPFALKMLSQVICFCQVHVCRSPSSKKYIYKMRPLVICR